MIWQTPVRYSNNGFFSRREVAIARKRCILKRYLALLGVRFHPEDKLWLLQRMVRFEHQSIRAAYKYNNYWPGPRVVRRLVSTI
jgi:hypothetical protein